MKITKNKAMFLISVFIVAVVFNVVVFVIPFAKSEGFWTGYVFSMFALLLTTVVCLYAFRKEGLKSKFYGVPLLMVAGCYLIVQLTLGIVQMVLTPVPFQYWIALNTILLGVCLVGLIAGDAGIKEIERVDEKIKENVFFIKSLQVDVECLENKPVNESMKKLLKSLAETIQYSDPMSNPQLAAIENEIGVKVALLSEAVEKADDEAGNALCNELQQLFAERNKKCKILK